MHTGKNKDSKIKRVIRSIVASVLLCIGFISIAIFFFERKYEDRIFPNVTIQGVPFGGKTKQEVSEYWEAKNLPFSTAQFEMIYEDHIATMSGSELELGYDAALSATQAYLVGRSNGILTNLYQQFFTKNINKNWDYFNRSEPFTEIILESLYNMR